LAVLILAWAAGCIVAVEEPGRRVVVEDTHVCVGSCDHLYVDGGWYMSRATGMARIAATIS